MRRPTCRILKAWTTGEQPVPQHQQNKAVDRGLQHEAGEELTPLKINRTPVERVEHFWYMIHELLTEHLTCNEDVSYGW